jgi:hypothetical protein
VANVSNRAEIEYHGSSFYRKKVFKIGQFFDSPFCSFFCTPGLLHNGKKYLKLTKLKKLGYLKKLQLYDIFALLETFEKGLLCKPSDLKSDNLQYNMPGRRDADTNDSSTKRLMFQVLFFS